MNNSKVYIHYGSDHFYRKLFNEIENRSFLGIKPHGGLWASPINSENSWFDFCEFNSFSTSCLSESFKFKLRDGSSILFIDSDYILEKLKKLGYTVEIPDRYKTILHDLYYLDFEKLLKDGVDAIEVYINNETYRSLYGWDVDSLLVLNPDCVIEIN